MGLTSLELISKLLFGPPDWLVNNTSARSRRTFGFWNFVIAIALTPFFGNEVLFVTVLSIMALVPNFTAETPVEEEDA